MAIGTTKRKADSNCPPMQGEPGPDLACVVGEYDLYHLCKE